MCVCVCVYIYTYIYIYIYIGDDLVCRVHVLGWKHDGGRVQRRQLRHFVRGLGKSRVLGPFVGSDCGGVRHDAATCIYT